MTTPTKRLTREERERLRDIADEVGGAEWWPPNFDYTGLPEERLFISAASPMTVFALLDRIEELEEGLRPFAEAAIGGIDPLWQGSEKLLWSDFQRVRALLREEGDDGK